MAVKKTAPKYTKAALIAASETLFQQPPEVVAGALLNTPEPLNRETAANRIRAFLADSVNKGGI